MIMRTIATMPRITPAFASPAPLLAGLRDLVLRGAAEDQRDDAQRPAAQDAEDPEHQRPDGLGVGALRNGAVRRWPYCGWPP